MSKRKSRQAKTPNWVSQNFLTSSKIIKRLINKTSLNINDKVIEIGSGKGHITDLLLKKCKQVVAIEVDDKLYSRLKDKFIIAKNLTLHHQDFLKWKLPAISDYKVFSNIPFNHTTAIIRKLTESPNPPQEAWLLVEKGAAKRFMGRPNESLRSLMIKLIFDLRIAYYLKKEDFHPKPRVDVVMLHLKRKAKPDVSQKQWRSYQNFICQALRNKGYGLYSMFTRKQLVRALRKAGIENDIVPAEILYIQWLCLFRCYRRYVLGK